MLNYVFFSEHPMELEYMQLSDGKADVYLRRSIREVEDGWVADEAYMRCTYTIEEIEANFDRIFDEAALWEPEQPYTPTMEERITTLEESGIFGRISDGLFFPADAKPDSIGRGSVILSEARREKLGRQSLAVSVGIDVTLAREAEKGSTEYRLANNYANRILAQVFDGAAVCTSRETTAETVRVRSVKLESGGAVVPSTAGGGQIVITTETSANKYELTKKLRVYPHKAGFANLYVGTAGSTGGTTGYSVVSGQGVMNEGNASIVAGSTIYNVGSTSLVTGRMHINRQQNAFLGGEGHDTTNASNGVAAVGKYAMLESDTAFAVGNGTDNAKRSNAFEVKADGAATMCLKAPSGALYRLAVDNDGNLTTIKVQEA